MTTIQFQPERLLRLAQRLLELNISNCADEIENDNRFLNREGDVIETIPFFQYVFNEVAGIFNDEWVINVEGDVPFWIFDDECETISSALNFFGITRSMFAHLFIPGAQNLLYGGRILTVNSTCKEIAFNILSLIQTEEMRRN
jgi:hypothetical protein